jgi:hypothetical protein
MSDHIKKYSPAYVDEYVRSAVHGFVGDPPDSNYQSGYLAALLVIAQEALGHRLDMSPYAEADPLQKFLRPRYQRA